jgi:hypothetical protein
MGELVCSKKCVQSIACLPFSQNLSNKGKENIEEKTKNEKMNNLGHSVTLLVFQIINSPLSLTNLFSLQNDAM